MKTSNKIFSFGFLTSIIFTIGALIFVKSNMVPTEQLTGDGEIISETRKVGAFDKISTNGSMRVQIHNGEPAIKIDSYENIMDAIVTEVKDGELSVGFKPGSYNNVGKHTTVHVTTNNLKKLTATGGGNIFSKDTLKLNQLDLQAGGGGYIELILDASNVNSEISGGGEIRLFGSCSNLKTNTSGGARLNAFDINIKNADMNIYGGGRANINAEKLTRAKVSGGGNLIYKGNPTIENLDISGGGRIKKQ